MNTPLLMGSFFRRRGREPTGRCPFYFRLRRDGGLSLRDEVGSVLLIGGRGG